MSEELRPISLKTIPDAIELLNESSKGTSLEYNVDFFSFLSLAAHWRFSYEHSFVSYVDGKPAAVILNGIDPEAHEAYTFYWGARPKSRNPKIALNLMEASCDRLRKEGYLRVYADSAADRPVRRYRFIQYYPLHILAHMAAANPDLPPADPRFEVRKVDLELLASSAPAPDGTVHWSQRLTYLRNAPRALEFFGAYCDHTLRAYAVVASQPSGTNLVDLRSTTQDITAGYELLRSLTASNHLLPFTANSVAEPGYAFSVLASSGFVVTRRVHALVRDLCATCKSRPGEEGRHPASAI